MWEFISRYLKVDNRIGILLTYVAAQFFIFGSLEIRIARSENFDFLLNGNFILKHLFSMNNI